MAEKGFVTIIGVRFRQAGKIYYFDPANITVNENDHVIVETVKGIEYGTVVVGRKDVSEDQIIPPLKKIIRVANEADMKQVANNKAKEEKAYEIALQKIADHNLPMKLVGTEYTFDGNKILFYFTADGRIDFRELVKDLAAVFHVRIELRQIGVRDETKIMGDIGLCGRELCCHTYLSDFTMVSIKMAKEQHLSLNPAKLSGVCGRLKCCLANEEETYEYLNSKLPNVGDTVTTPDGSSGDVVSVNVLRQLVHVVISGENDEREMREYNVDDLKFKSRSKRRDNRKNNSAEEKELKELEAMEKKDKDGKTKLNNE